MGRYTGLLGLAAITKLPFLLFGLYYAVRGRWAVVAGAIDPLLLQAQGPLRRAGLVHRAEAFLLEVLTAGHVGAFTCLADRQPLAGEVLVGALDGAEGAVPGASQFADGRQAVAGL
jgi:hypothetical protein